MSCFVNRWGPGTTCEKPVNSESAKEMQARITAMNQERAKQDMIWNLPSDTTLISKSSSIQSKPNKPT